MQTMPTAFHCCGQPIIRCTRARCGGLLISTALQTITLAMLRLTARSASKDIGMELQATKVAAPPSQPLQCPAPRHAPKHARTGKHALSITRQGAISLVAPTL